MSIHDKLAALAAELHVTGFSSEMTTAWHGLSTLVADEIHKLSGAAPADAGEKIEHLVMEKLNSIEPFIKAELARIEMSIDDRVKTLFGQLLAQATAAETAKTPPEAPAAATVAAVAEAPADASAATEAAAAV